MSSTECRPVLPCADDTYRCNDGSCRVSLDLCPHSNSCKKNKPYMCENGACAFNSSLCLNEVGCPKNTPIKCK